MSKGSKIIKPGVMKVRILPPIDASHLRPGREGREELMKTVRDQMERVLESDQPQA